MSGGITVVRLLRLLALAVLVAVFGWSGLSKLMDPPGFALSLFRHHILPSATVNIVSLWITWLELVAVFILLFVPRCKKAALWLILGLLAAFSVSIGINLIRGSHITCGCFSTSPLAQPISWWSLLKNAGLALTGIFLLISGRTAQAPLLRSHAKQPSQRDDLL